MWKYSFLNKASHLQPDRKIFKPEVLKGQIFASEKSSLLLAAICSSVVWFSRVTQEPKDSDTSPRLVVWVLRPLGKESHIHFTEDHALVIF